MEIKMLVSVQSLLSWKTEQPSRDWKAFSLPDASPVGSAAGPRCSGGGCIGAGYNSSDSSEEELAAGWPITSALTLT